MSQLFEWLQMLADRGGPVMIALFALSVVSLTLIGERVWFWTWFHLRVPANRVRRLNDSLRRGDRNNAETLVSHHRTPLDHVARTILAKGASEAVIADSVQEARPSLDRFMVMLSTIITAAPLLGILGTVIGIIHSFRLLGEQTVLTDPRDISGGIAEALLTTAMGLIIALFTLFPYMFFRSQVDQTMNRLEAMIAAAQHGEKQRQSSSRNSEEDKTKPTSQFESTERVCDSSHVVELAGAQTSRKE